VRRRITRQSFQKTPPSASRIGTRKLPTRPAPKKISIARLPVTGSDVFGREEDIAFLDGAWANKDVNVVTIVAWAGVGKSTLVNHWLRRMAVEQYRSAQLVFGWSFFPKRFEIFIGLWAISASFCLPAIGQEHKGWQSDSLPANSSASESDTQQRSMASCLKCSIAGMLTTLRGIWRCTGSRPNCWL
jgi:hypothetical protein